MNPGVNEDVDSIGEFPLLTRLLQAAAERGEGTVLRARTTRPVPHRAGLGVAEAAGVMQLSAGAVKRYTSDGLRRLRERLDPASVA